MPRDLERELMEMDGWPPAWNPSEGEVLVGVIRLYDQGYSPHGVVRTAILQRDDGSRVSLWLNATLLLSLFEREKPRVGERIGLRYLGKHPTKGYRRYHLIVDREPAEGAFTPLGGECDDDEPAPEDAAREGAGASRMSPGGARGARAAGHDAPEGHRPLPRPAPAELFRVPDTERDDPDEYDADPFAPEEEGEALPYSAVVVRRQEARRGR